jgi:hypothetical protein
MIDQNHIQNLTAALLFFWGSAARTEEHGDEDAVGDGVSGGCVVFGGSVP